MEAGYTKTSLFGRNLIPELEELAKNNLSFPGHTQTAASGWTQAAHVNVLLGIPLLHIIPNEATKQKTFLKNACSVTDELFKQGYSICKISGASGKFANENTLYRTHHVDNIYDRDYYDSLGYDTLGNKGTGWGYKDEFIYNQAFDEYKKLRTQENPFCMIIKTVDTHFPYGYIDDKYNVYGDTRDAMIRASVMCRTFVDRIRSFEDNTTIIILGDHLWMDAPSDAFTDFTKKLHPRKIYNCFINTVFSPDEVDTQRAFAPFDMAPTILESIGAHIEGGRFGLGTSLYSKQKTLVEQYGADYINKEFQKEHPFYLTLF